MVIINGSLMAPVRWGVEAKPGGATFCCSRSGKRRFSAALKWRRNPLSRQHLKLPQP